MKKLTIMLWAVVLAAAVPSPVFGNIVYSGSQNVTLALSPMSPMASKIIQLDGTVDNFTIDTKWDDFRVELWFDMGVMGMPGMTGMSMGSHLTISQEIAPYAPYINAPGGWGILGLQGFASNLNGGALIGPDSFFDIFMELPLGGDDRFGEDGGYIGLRTAMGQNGWLHMKSQSKIGTENHSVVFDGWAYEDQPGVPIAAGQGAVCDWVRGQPYKMHWPQLPDLGSTGIDISLSRTPLADDFKCTATGPITDIHIWGSFLNDVLPPGGPESLTLQLSIYSDIPAMPATTANWSRPDSLKWTKTFKPGEYSARRVHDGPEDWYDPVTGQYLPANHRQAFQYNFCIDRDAFEQQEGTIYWLVVEDLSTNATSTNASTFGWKTTSLQYRWNDDAVYQGSANAGWTAMTYPKGHRYEGKTLDLAFVITADDKTKPEADLGDAPDCSNSLPGVTMLAYPGVLGHFPTVYQAGSPPYGPLHRHPKDMFFLGKGVSLETEADLGPDEDGVNNLGLAAFPGLTLPGFESIPAAGDYIPAVGDTANRGTPVADRDGFDDGLHQPVVYIPAAGDWTTTINYDVTCTSTQATRAYVNVWFDFNRDGDWDDVASVTIDTAEPEWAVQNQVVSISGWGTRTFTTPPFNCSHLVRDDGAPLWVRITIAEHPIDMGVTGGTLVGGAGPADGYLYGETEDYYIRPEIGPTAVKYDWGDAPETATAGGYPTLLASNGARHVPVGPWLGDDSDRPDSEPDGQPDLHARGDDTHGNSDENGVSIPPLVQGQLASATIEVNGGGGVVQGWIDFNRDRQWQAAESVFNGFLPNGVQVISFSVPNAAIVGQSFARFRISRNGGLGPVGAAPDGEVEDHEVSIGASPTGGDGKTWCQPPDCTPQGIDIRVDNQTLADDFECKSTGLLTHIRLWGSWKGDHKGQIKKIHVQIRRDDPVGPEGADKSNKFSKPGPETLWGAEFVPGQFQETLYHKVGGQGEWWWDPVSEKASPGGDTQVWQIDMDVESADAFKQEGTAAVPVIYWLAVEVETTNGEFGWKTRQWPEHFMDDAVWEISSITPVTWDELRYPDGHPYFDSEHNSIDLAFCLMFSTQTPPPTILPGTATACPAVETRCPMIETRCPPVATKCPQSATKCPESFTKCPPAETKCPVAETKCPVEQTKCPLTATQCQSVATECPAVQTYCPAEDTKCPPTSPTKCPVEETKCPPVNTQCPATETQCPLIATQCRVVDTQCPAKATRCPKALTKCPTCGLGSLRSDAEEAVVFGVSCPIVETLCPTIGEYLAIAEARQ